MTARARAICSFPRRCVCRAVRGPCGIRRGVCWGSSRWRLCGASVLATRFMRATSCYRCCKACWARYCSRRCCDLAREVRLLSAWWCRRPLPLSLPQVAVGAYAHNDYLAGKIYCWDHLALAPWWRRSRCHRCCLLLPGVAGSGGAFGPPCCGRWRAYAHPYSESPSCCSCCRLTLLPARCCLVPTPAATAAAASR